MYLPESFAPEERVWPEWAEPVDGQDLLDLADLSPLLNSVVAGHANLVYFLHFSAEPTYFADFFYPNIADFLWNINWFSLSLSLSLSLSEDMKILFDEIK